jgi:hypothetical protein
VSNIPEGVVQNPPQSLLIEAPGFKIQRRSFFQPQFGSAFCRKVF